MKVKVSIDSRLGRSPWVASKMAAARPASVGPRLFGFSSRQTSTKDTTHHGSCRKGKEGGRSGKQWGSPEEGRVHRQAQGQAGEEDQGAGEAGCRRQEEGQETRH